MAKLFYHFIKFCYIIKAIKYKGEKDLMKYCTPESAGISSRDIMKFYKALEGYRLSTHSVIMAKGDKILTECYYAPFNKDFLHRMYSVSKSFVSVAVGFCVQDGLLSLDAPMADYFEEYLKDSPEAYRLSATIRELLKMETTREGSLGWFKSGCADRTAVYFTKQGDKYPNTLFKYDSSGSYMLGVIVEKVTGKPFLKYLQEKVLDDIGFSKNAYCLKVPGGHSFGDSGVMCTAEDLLLFARFLLNGGVWEGKRYLNEEYIKEAVTPSVCNNDFGFAEHGGFGYGYLFWGMAHGCFAMHGMGNQIALCDPKRDFIFVINSDNQGNPHNYEHVYAALYYNVMNKLSDRPLPEDEEARAELDAYISEQKLFCLYESPASRFSEKISGKIFDCEENPMGIKWFRLDFEGDTGIFAYENAQGEKSFCFGFGHNEFGKFPQENYSDLVATVAVKGHRYDGAFSADWPEEKKLRVRVQIIDKYFGNLAVIFGFRDEKTVSVRMVKKAEAFLEEYEGIMNAKRREI